MESTTSGSVVPARLCTSRRNMRDGVTRPPGTVPRQNVGESIGKCFPHSFPAIGGTRSHVHGRRFHGVRGTSDNRPPRSRYRQGIYLSPTVSALAKLHGQTRRATPARQRRIKMQRPDGEIGSQDGRAARMCLVPFLHAR